MSDDIIVHTSSVRSVGSTGTDRNTDTSIAAPSLSSSQTAIVRPPIENRSLLSAIDYDENDEDENNEQNSYETIQRSSSSSKATAISTGDHNIEKEDSTKTKETGIDILASAAVLVINSSSSSLSTKPPDESTSTTTATNLSASSIASSPSSLSSSISSSPPNRSKQVLGMFLVLSASLAFSCMALFVSMLGNTLPSLQSNWIRFIVQVLLTSITIILNAIKDHQSRTLTDIYTWFGPREQWFRLLQRGLWGVGGMGSYFYALQSVSLADATALVFINVPLTALFAHFLLKEPYGLIDIVTGLLCMLGVIFISQPPSIFGNLDNHSNPISWIVIIVIFLGSCCSAMAYITIRTIGSGVSPLTVVLWFSLVGTVFAPILAWILQSFTDLSTLNSTQIWLIIGIGFCGWIGQILLNRGIALSPVGPATVMRYADVVFALIFQSTLLNDPPGGLKLFGVVLIMSCVVGSLYKQQKKNKESSNTVKDPSTATAAASIDGSTKYTDKPSISSSSSTDDARNDHLATIGSSISLDRMREEKDEDIHNILIVEEDDDDDTNGDLHKHQQEQEEVINAVLTK